MVIRHTHDCRTGHGPLYGGTIRHVPRHRWWRVYIGRVRHPGHQWMYSGTLRRDTFTLLGWGVILMRLPRGPRPALRRSA